jgi:hypothetical protein
MRKFVRTYDLRVIKQPRNVLVAAVANSMFIAEETAG